MKNKEYRLKEITKILSTENIVFIKDLAKLFDVSEMTIRRDSENPDFKKIARIEKGMVISSNGNPTSNQGYDLLNQSKVEFENKARIGKFAASLIEEKDVVIFDTGTTTEQITANLPENIEIVAICFNLNNLNNLTKYKNVTIELAGGHYYPNTQLFESRQGIDFIKNIRANKVFLSMAGAHKNLGITCANKYEVDTKMAIINTAIKRILVSDSSKFGTVNLAHFCEFSDIDVIVTDKNLSNDWQEFINSKEIELYCI